MKLLLFYVQYLIELSIAGATSCYPLVIETINLLNGIVYIESNSIRCPTRNKKIQYNERRREAYNNKSAEEKNKLNARRRALQVDAMDEESLHYPLSDDYHVTFGIPLDIQALEHQTSHDKDENQVNFDFGSEDINNSTPKVFGFGRLAKIGESPWCLPEAPVCMHCGAKKFHREPPGFCCSNGQVSLSALNVPNELRDLFFGSSQMCLHFKANSRTYNNAFAFTSFGVTYDKELCRRQGKLICNCIFMILRMSLREIPELHDYKIILRADPGLDQRIYNVPTVDQVAGKTSVRSLSLEISEFIQNLVEVKR
ncbi:hypothetical protein Sango_0986000 [Sesamum angolense]|uniref:Uncharacterized protein n=1 Tax=Sesamum angolense TaxID=2727404 RepID=A0AAE2BYG7_9LAMI|nr:hypothetical protein Sango_0986000 [Sesamum angolense]